jgi:hypothetical protein
MNREQWNEKRDERSNRSDCTTSSGPDYERTSSGQPHSFGRPLHPAMTTAANCSHYDALSCCEWAILEEAMHQKMPHP